MNSKFRRVAAFISAVMLVFAVCVMQPMRANAELATGTLLWVFAQICGSLGMDMTMNPSTRTDVTEAFKVFVQNSFEKLAELEPFYLATAGLVLRTVDGRTIMDIRAQDMAKAAEMLRDELPSSVTYQRSTKAMNTFSYTIDSTWKYKPYSYSKEQEVYGRWYVYENLMMNTTNNKTESESFPAAMFIYQYAGSNGVNNLTDSNYYTWYIVKMGSDAYNFLVEQCPYHAHDVKNVDTGEDVMLKSGYLSEGLPVPTSGICSQYYKIAWDKEIKVYDTTCKVLTIPVYKDGDTTVSYEFAYGTDCILSSELGFEASSVQESREMTALKNQYGELAKLLEQFIKDNPELADDVISVPVDDDTIGNDLPGLLAWLKQLEINQAQGTQDLISALEKALAKAAEEAGAISGSVTGIAEGVTAIGKDITDIKEKVKELTEATTEETKVDLKKMKITASLATRFPFCIPFDLASAFSNVGGMGRTAPKWTLPWTVKGTTAAIELDLAEFEEWAKVIRWGTLITFNIGLIMITRKLIKG